MTPLIAAFAILFAVCPLNGRACEEGYVTAPSCAAGMQWLRDTTPAGYVLEIQGCVPAWQAPR